MEYQSRFYSFFYLCLARYPAYLENLNRYTLDEVKLIFNNTQSVLCLIFRVMGNRFMLLGQLNAAASPLSQDQVQKLQGLVK